MEINYLQTIILGIIQGASEFLPISSSGHLVIAPWIFGWDDPGLAFDVALHFGTLLAVALFFWRDWVKIFKLAFKNDNSGGEIYTKSTLWLLVVATIPGVLAGFFLENLAETAFRNPLLVAFNLFFWGLILYLSDMFSKKIKDIKKIGWLDSIIIGLSQALAIIPGTSRSGITISTGLARGLDRVSAARFSFLMLTPIVFGASVLKIGDLLNNLNSLTIAGIIAAALSGYLAIKYLLIFVSKVNYKIFFWYRLALALIIVLFVVLR